MELREFSEHRHVDGEAGIDNLKRLKDQLHLFVSPITIPDFEPNIATYQELYITNYCLVCEYTLYELSHKVREKIAEGWQPFGNILSFPYNGADAITQPMVKYAPEPSTHQSPIEKLLRRKK